MKRSTLTVGEMIEFIQDFAADPDTPIEVNLDGHTFEIDYIELDTDRVIRIHLEK